MGQTLAAGCCGAWEIWRRNCYSFCSNGLDAMVLCFYVDRRRVRSVHENTGGYCRCSVYCKCPQWMEERPWWCSQLFSLPTAGSCGLRHCNCQTKQQSHCLECSLRSRWGGKKVGVGGLLFSVHAGNWDFYPEEIQLRFSTLCTAPTSWLLTFSMVRTTFSNISASCDVRHTNLRVFMGVKYNIIQFKLLIV